MPPVGFEPTISAGQRPQTDALVRAATETGTVRDTSNTKFFRHLNSSLQQPVLVISLSKDQKYHTACLSLTCKLCTLRHSVSSTLRENSGPSNIAVY